jgi:nicotinamide-nucleotide amidase
MRAEVLTIGDELCRGEIVNTNASYIAGRLWDLDITTRWMTSCTDDEADIVAAVTAACARADVVVCSGGLGPTEDDLTVDVMSKLAGTSPVVDEPHRAKMAARFAQGNVALTPIQLRQVRVPVGARVYLNPAGLAPGFEVAIASRDLRPASSTAEGGAVAIAGVPVICLPGVPRELYAMWDAGVEARLLALRGERSERIARRIYRVFGRGESQISQACRGVVGDVAGASIHYQVKFPETLVKIVVRDHDVAAAQGRLEAIDGELRRRLSGYLYATGDEMLPEKVTRALIAAGKTVATAESCTGGMIGELLTRTPGSSRAYLGGAITYADAEKMRQLGVAAATLAAHGAVSEQVVREMAEGARARFRSDLAVAVSGVAGPDGGTPDKPVGLVWLALSTAQGTRTLKIQWPGARDQVRTLASWWALKLIDEALSAKDG